jgi:hypothetical protein
MREKVKFQFFKKYLPCLLFFAKIVLGNINLKPAILANYFF